MKTLLILLSLIVVTTSSPVFEFEPLSDAQIFYINNVVNTTWKAGRNFAPEELGRVKKMLGVRRSSNLVLPPRRETSYPVEFIIPPTFDAREKWPHCPSVRAIRDQGDCGSCWAVSTAEVISDRICIYGLGNVIISSEDVISCCTTCGLGCEGGFPMAAFDYWKTEGVVTGGPYESNEGCYPYELPPSGHGTNDKLTPWTNMTGDSTPKCKNECRPGYGKTFKQDKHYASQTYSVMQYPSQIQEEILEGGPVGATFTVYADFPSYKSGVYKHVSGAALGGHAVKIIGWGVENKVPYWLVANSWNVGWGDKGFFKILRGNDECGIESGITSGIPVVKGNN